jgi:hypothetical protein
VDHPGTLVEKRLQALPESARKLFGLIVQQAYHGPLRSKPNGTATPPEILEACGLDVGDFYALLESLSAAGLIEVCQPYPFEEIRLISDVASEFQQAGQTGEQS